MNDHPGMPLARDVRRNFDRAAAGFDDADFVHRATFDALLERLKPMTLEPRMAVDLGCATGSGARPLAQRFRGCRIVGVDLSHAMASRAARRGKPFRRHAAVQADARALPFAEESVDLVVSNLLLPWLLDPTPCLTEVGRVLRRDGLFAFATLGPESLAELRSAWRSIDEDPHVNAFTDMHDIGDALVRAGLRDPVLDVEFLDITYRDTASLYRDLAAAGARNALAGRRPTLTGKARLDALDTALAGRMRDGLLSLRLELVYGHAFGGGPRPPAGEFRLDPGSIGRRRHD